jgi:asparagine synthase (glutamine-hydrolysing)
MSWFTPAMKSLLYRDALKQAVRGYDPFSVMQEYFDHTKGWDPLSRIQYVDVKTYLVDDILTKVDRASMAHSLEVRVPLLDHEVMEYAANIPAGYKLRRGEGKFIFKQALADLLPGEVLHRPKMGFSLPLAHWLRSELRRTFEARVLAKDAFLTSLLDPAVIQRWWAQHQRQTRDYAYHLWALLILECWGQKFLR